MGEVEYDPTVVPKPSSELRELGERMVGRSRLTGGVEGTVRFDWMEGGYFLIQHVDLVQHGRAIRGIEIIGHLRPESRHRRRSAHASMTTRATPSTTSTSWKGTPSLSGVERRARRPT
jgi:hypothetical protein